MIIGIDPGVSGAICVYDEHANAIVEMYDMPTFAVNRGQHTEKSTRGRRRADAIGICAILSRFPDARVVMEAVNAQRGDSGASMFTFGQAVGCVQGAVAALRLRMELVLPARWKGDLRIPADKNVARERASQLIPLGWEYWPLAQHHDRAEAALLAYWGATYLK